MGQFDGTYELLARAVIYLPSALQSFAISLATSNGYQIDQVFDDPITDLQALGLTSLDPDRPPLLVFRGTESALDDRANADPLGVGFTQFQANRPAIGTWLAQVQQDTSKNPQKLRAAVIGHSLGGALVQRTVAAFPHLIQEAVTFNSAGLDAATANACKASGATVPLTHYIVRGDVVSLGGEAFLPGTVYLQSFTSPQIDPLAPLTKHGLPFNLLTSPPPGYSQRQISIDELNSPTFTYSNDSNYEQLQAALKFALPSLAPAITNRSTLEALRSSPGFSYTATIAQVRTALAPDQDNYLLGDDQDNYADGMAGNDVILGRGGNDWLIGGLGNDRISGSDGDDGLLGSEGDDRLTGGAGKDFLIGGLGNDVLIGDTGADFMSGGGGSDRYVYAGANTDEAFGQSLAAAPDLLGDFSFAQKDKFRLEFDRTASGADLPHGLFNAGTQTAANLAEAATAAYADKDQRQPGAQTLQANEAVFFYWQYQAYLSVNNGVQSFSGDRDLVVGILDLQLRQRDVTAGVLTVSDYFG